MVMQRCGLACKSHLSVPLRAVNSSFSSIEMPYALPTYPSSSPLSLIPCHTC